jgi:hypothetical protein
MASLFEVYGPDFACGMGQDNSKECKNKRKHKRDNRSDRNPSRNKSGFSQTYNGYNIINKAHKKSIRDKEAHRKSFEAVDRIYPTTNHQYEYEYSAFGDYIGPDGNTDNVKLSDLTPGDENYQDDDIKMEPANIKSNRVNSNKPRVYKKYNQDMEYSEDNDQSDDQDNDQDNVYNPLPNQMISENTDVSPYHKLKSDDCRDFFHHLYTCSKCQNKLKKKIDKYLKSLTCNNLKQIQMGQIPMPDNLDKILFLDRDEYRDYSQLTLGNKYKNSQYNQQNISSMENFDNQGFNSNLTDDNLNSMLKIDKSNDQTNNEKNDQSYKTINNLQLNLEQTYNKFKKSFYEFIYYCQKYQNYIILFIGILLLKYCLCSDN